ncbi:MAG: hypothetical protein IPH77_10570 [Ignavibacteria bacterium]|nr:hypothetical protein [Ignavibacteria bacterium]
MTAKIKKEIASKAPHSCFHTCVFFIVIGQIIMETMNIFHLSAFQISGGMILFVFFTMIFGWANLFG